MGVVLFALALVASAATARAQGPSGSKFDTSAPIEIFADEGGELDQVKKIAVFRGNVDTIQGDLHLRTDKLSVYYTESSGNGKTMESSISKIVADGNVFLSSPAETAQGERGVYDVVKGIITLTGSVMLTRGDSVIRGDTFIFDLKTGRSKVTSGGASGSGRVRAIIRPRGSRGQGKGRPAP